MHTFNRNHYESIKFRDDGSGILDAHGYRIRIRMHIPEQKKVHWIDLFKGNKAGGCTADSVQRKPIK